MLIFSLGTVPLMFGLGNPTLAQQNDGSINNSLPSCCGGASSL